MAEDELKLRRDAERGIRAKALAEDPLVQEAFALIEADVIRQWKASEPSETQMRERCHVVTAVLGQFRANLAQMISDGKVAQAALNTPKSNPKGRAA